MKRPTLFIGCDGLYFNDEAEIPVPSLLINSPPPCIFLSICHPQPDCAEKIRQWQILAPEVTIEYETYTRDLTALSANEKKAFFANYRFIRLHEFVRRSAKDVFFLDVDSLVRNDLTQLSQHFANSDIAIRLRLDSKKIKFKLLAGGIYIQHNAISLAFLNRLAKRLHNNQRWFADQIALYHSLRWTRGLRISDLNQTYFDWEFEDHALIWTGKGERKFTNAKYVSYAEQLLTQFRTQSANAPHQAILTKPQPEPLVNIWRPAYMLKFFKTILGK